MTRGFWVERVGSETRKTGVSRALYVMVRITDAGCCGKMSARDEDVVKVYPSSETFGAATARTRAPGAGDARGVATQRELRAGPRRRRG